MGNFPYPNGFAGTKIVQHYVDYFHDQEVSVSVLVVRGKPDLEEKEETISHVKADDTISPLSSDSTPEEQNQWLFEELLAPLAGEESFSYQKRISVLGIREDKANFYKLAAFSDEGKVVTLSIFRDYDGTGVYRIGTMVNVRDNEWHSYPPLSNSNAYSILTKQYPETSFELESNDFFHTDDSSPSYLFSTTNDDENQIYLVNAEDGSILTTNLETLTSDKSNNSEQTLQSLVFLSDDGYLQVKEEAKDLLSESEYQLFLKDTESSNIDIRNGNLEIDENLNVIFKSY